MRLPARDALAEITGMPASMVPCGRRREALGSDFYTAAYCSPRPAACGSHEGRETKARSW
jgi:hypothetical protein